MIYIPNDAKVRGGIEQGSVYNFAPNKGVANHYHIVLNKNPKKDDEVYLVSFTSSKENTLRYIKNFNFDIKTLVEIENGECSFLSKPQESCINCNFLKKYDIQKLIDLINDSNGSCNYPTIQDKLIKRIIEGVKKSTLISDEIKSFL